MKRSYFTALLLMLFFCNCSKEPVACFEIESSTSNKSEAKVLDDITFRNCSIDATEYSWDFGDGKRAQAINPSHSYSKGGEYTVTLEAHGNGGDQLTTEIISILSLDGNWEGAFKIGTTAFLFYLDLTQNGIYIDGSFELEDGTAASIIKSSQIKNDKVIIIFNVKFESVTYMFQFQGNANDSYSHIDGDFLINNERQGTWSVNKISTKSKSIKDKGQNYTSDIDKMIHTIIKN